MHSWAKIENHLATVDCHRHERFVVLHWNWLPNLFGLQNPVPQRMYAVTGFGLVTVKYSVEAAILGTLTGQIYTPFDFVNPMLAGRERFTAQGPLWLGMGWVLWTLPFLWIAVSMSVRRAAYLGFSPWCGLIVLVPTVNIPAMFALALIPDPERETEESKKVCGMPREEQDRQLDRSQSRSGVMAAIAGLSVGVAFMLGMVTVSVFLFESYGTAIFFGTPIITGAVAAFVFNTPAPRTLGETLAHALGTLAVACFAFLVFGLEGAICIVMAVPIMIPLGLLGALVGFAIATRFSSPRRNERRGMLSSIVLLPLLAAIEPSVQSVQSIEVMSSVEVAAPPERVWKHVVTFPEITERPDWFFRLGIASPVRARIVGDGVGATRYCEFTTGVFVEPITAWEAPRHLAFDVTDQPEPMFELTPYRHLHPPHLDNSFRSRRGEFRLIPRTDGGTRLEGRTWYELRIYPIAYWRLWSDSIVHRIHARVLRQIQVRAESAE